MLLAHRRGECSTGPAVADRAEHGPAGTQPFGPGGAVRRGGAHPQRDGFAGEQRDQLLVDGSMRVDAVGEQAQVTDQRQSPSP